jgi:hypothetical protein
VGINAGTTLGRFCQNTRWDTEGLPSHKLEPHQIVTAINYSGGCAGACWDNSTIFISNNKGQFKHFDLPIKNMCADLQLRFIEKFTGGWGVIQLDASAPGAFAGGWTTLGTLYAPDYQL